MNGTGKLLSLYLSLYYEQLTEPIPESTKREDKPKKKTEVDHDRFPPNVSPALIQTCGTVQTIVSPIPSGSILKNSGDLLKLVMYKAHKQIKGNC